MDVDPARPEVATVPERAGLLGPPYDERTYDLGEEPITASDAGPARLLAPMTLASLASSFDPDDYATSDCRGA